MSKAWTEFTSAPHRMYFFMGAIQAVLTMAWWLFELLGRQTSLFHYDGWVIPSLWAHAFLMIYGFFPFFMFGFLMTAAPNWVNGERIARSRYLPASLLMMAGAILFYPALVVGRPFLVLAGAIYLAGFVSGCMALMEIVARSSSRDKLHAYTVIGNVFIGCAGIAGYLLWFMFGNPAWLHFALATGIWLFLLPIFISISHRMIPFFSSTVLPNYVPHRPYWALALLLTGALTMAILELVDQTRMMWIPGLPMTATALYLTVLWATRRCLSIRLLAMLHISFAWLWIALGLYTGQSLMLFLYGKFVLGLAPLHALTVGYFSSMVFAMVTRVTLGHSGRLAVANKTAWYLFLLFQFAAISRILSDLVHTDAGMLLILAAIIWLCCFMLWSAIHLPIYWQPRVDQPGKN